MRRLLSIFFIMLGICFVASFAIAIVAHIDGSSWVIYPLGALVVVPIPIMLVLLYFIMQRALNDEPAGDTSTAAGALAADVIVAVAHAFPTTDRAAALTILSDYGDRPDEPDATRVHQAIVHLSTGALSRLRYFTDQAKQEYRDVLAWDAEMLASDRN